MNELIPRIDRLIEERDLRWHRQGRTLRVDLWEDGRSQAVRVSRERDVYRFASTALPAGHVTASDRRWRELALLAWQLNGVKPLVTFCFDDHERLTGQIDQPASSADDDELVLYIHSVALECDRLEYQLTGEDAE